MNDDILYIKRGNRSTIIYCANGKLYEIPINIDNYFNNLCLNELTTLTGRMNAIKLKYHIIKNVPIYINKQLVFFPSNNTKSIDNIYINSIYIKFIENMDSKCRIIFFNNQELIVDNSYNIIKNKYEKCIKIKNQICQSN